MAKRLDLLPATLIQKPAPSLHAHVRIQMPMYAKERCLQLLSVIGFTDNNGMPYYARKIVSDTSSTARVKFPDGLPANSPAGPFRSQGVNLTYKCKDESPFAL